MLFVKENRQNRREFLKLTSGFSLAVPASLSALSLLSSCASIDDYLFTDPPGLEDYVLIVGGGVSGLYAGYQLKKRKIPYRIFEASGRLGGQILASNKIEYGAFEFSNEDTTLLKLCKELNIETEKLGKKNWTFKHGSEIFLNQLTGSVIGLLPDRQIRLRHRLLGMEFNKKQIRMSFINEKNQAKSYTTHKAVVALPVQNLMGLQNFVRPDFEFRIADEIVIRVVVPALKPLPKSLAVLGKGQKLVRESRGYAYELLQHKGQLYVTLWNKGAEPSQFPQSLESLESFIAQEVLGQAQQSLRSQPQSQPQIDVKNKIILSPENVYDWSKHPTIRLSSLNQGVEEKPFSLSEYTRADALSNLLVVSDGLTKPMHRVETLLRIIDAQIDRFM